ncbi:MAG: transposase [Planctomycetes bacterium]|nr:transposase [Planctomycetota bacterium]
MRPTAMTRHEVTDEQWEMVPPILHKRAAKTGCPPSDPRLMLNGIFWILRTGSPWRDLPERFGPWQTVYDHFSKWRPLGAYDCILESRPIRLDAEGGIDRDLSCINGSSVRASRAAAGASKKAAVAPRRRFQSPATPTCLTSRSCAALEGRPCCPRRRRSASLSMQARGMNRAA